MRDDLFQSCLQLGRSTSLLKLKSYQTNSNGCIRAGRQDTIKGGATAVGDAVSRVAYLIAGCPIN